MNNHAFTAVLIAIVLTGIGMYFILPPFIYRAKLLSPEVYYELPAGGYIYIDGEYIRHNENEYNGTLDYQITLNYKFVEE